MSIPVLGYRHLSVSYRTSAGSVAAVRDLTFQIEAHESVGLVGESGCGKSTLAMATMGYLGDSGFISGGSIEFLGRNLVGLSWQQLQQIRGSEIAMVYQDPMAALNPSMTIGRQLVEGPVRLRLFSRREARDRAVAMLRSVQLRDPDHVIDRYPHQLSGGQQQRVVIAMALMTRPKMILLDEPTTGLDVTVEAAVLELISSLKARFGVTLLFISHNLGLVAQVCDRVAIMYGGEIVEFGTVEQIFKSPRHPYTQALLACLPDGTSAGLRRRLPALPGHVPPPGTKIEGCVFGPRCSEFRSGLCDSGPIALERGGAEDHAVRCVRGPAPASLAALAPASGNSRSNAPRPLLRIEHLGKAYVGDSGFLGNLFASKHPAVKANVDLNFDARESEILALVGESGSGKSTFAKILTGLETADEGRIIVNERDVSRLPADRRSSDLLKMFQMVFQNPDDTLNPSFSVGATIRRALKKAGVSRGERPVKLNELLALVRLPKELAALRPQRLSGGQKQRVAIARALASDPSVLVCDEPVSALDVSVQAAISNLLLDIQDGKELTIVLISHDLGLVHHMADRVVVMYAGRVVQIGATGSVFSRPQHPYTEVLLSARLNPDPDRPTHAIPMAEREPGGSGSGCCFAGRCPRYIGPICDEQAPPARSSGEDNVFYCHWLPHDLVTAARRSA